MKKTFIFLTVLLLILFSNLFAQEDDDGDRPYLTDEDISAIEALLPDDVVIREVYTPPPSEPEQQQQQQQDHDPDQRYYLVVLDRSRCAPDADIQGLDISNILYKYLHNRNDYLILIYKTSGDEQVNPVYPAGARVSLEFMTSSINPIRNLANSEFIKLYVIQERVLIEIKDALE